jgi:polar amino acid transport system substrate-binding protein
MISVFLVGGLGTLSCQRWSPEEKPSAKTDVRESHFKDTSAAKKPKRQSTLEAITARGELRVGMQVGYVPFQMYGENGDLIGLEVDLAEMAASRMNVVLRVVRLTWQELIPSLLEGRTDVVMSGMTATPERNIQVLFTIPVIETGRMFLVHASNEQQFKNLEDLDKPGTFIVSTPGGLGGLRVRELLPNASYREFPDRKSSINEVLERRAHAFIDEEFSVRLACAMHSRTLTSRFKPITYEPVSWAVRPRDVHWLNWLNNFIRQIHHDGRLDSLKKKWLRDYFLDISTPGK